VELAKLERHPPLRRIGNVTGNSRRSEKKRPVREGIKRLLQQGVCAKWRQTDLRHNKSEKKTALNRRFQFTCAKI
jgi:hypothetical protein